MNKYLQCIFCYFFVCGTLVAQPSFAISSANVAPGSEFTVQVSAENLVSILAMQFSVNWDPNVVTFEKVNDFGIPFLGVGNFGLTNVDDGKLGMLWFDLSATSEGITATEADLFKIEFRANEGIVNEDAGIVFSGMPVSIEIGDTSNMAIDFTMVNEVTIVSDPNDIEELNKTITIGHNAPNPFCDETFIPIEVSETSEVKIEIINLTGARIYERTVFIHPGLHKINIPGDIFPANGTYLCSVLIGEKKVAKKLFYNGK